MRRACLSQTSTTMHARKSMSFSRKKSFCSIVCKVGGFNLMPRRIVHPKIVCNSALDGRARLATMSSTMMTTVTGKGLHGLRASGGRGPL